MVQIPSHPQAGGCTLLSALSLTGILFIALCLFHVEWDSLKIDHLLKSKKRATEKTKETRLSNFDAKLTEATEPLFDFAVLGQIGPSQSSSLISWIEEHGEVELLTALCDGDPDSLTEAVGKVPEVRSRGHSSTRGIVIGASNDLNSRDFGRFLHPETATAFALQHPIDFFEDIFSQQPARGCATADAAAFADEEIRRAFSPAIINLGFLLGNTSVSNPPKETQLIAGKSPGLSDDYTFPTPKRFFLYETTQLSDKNETRRSAFLSDLGDFLGLQKPPPPPLLSSSGRRRHEGLQVFDVCHYDCRPLRGILLSMGRSVSEWIRERVLPHPNVAVQNRDFLLGRMERWKEDPCMGPITYPEYED